MAPTQPRLSDIQAQTRLICGRGRKDQRGYPLSASTLYILWFLSTICRYGTEAGRLIGKPPIEFLEIPGVIDACRRSGKGFHTPRYYM